MMAEWLSLPQDLSFRRIREEMAEQIVKVEDKRQNSPETLANRCMCVSW